MRVLDAGAIARVRDEERPDPRDADELHDALVTAGFLASCEISIPITGLTGSGRATRASIGMPSLPDPRSPIPDPLTIWIAAERLPELLAIHPDAVLDPSIVAPPARAARAWTREVAIVELLRGRLSIVGPATAAALAASLGVAEADADAALLALESEGAVLRGRFSPDAGRDQGSGIGDPQNPPSRSPIPDPRPLEWCDRRLLARIHRYTLNRLRAEIAPVTPADFMRFLFAWQHVEPQARLTGLDGLREAIAQLDGVEAPARAWERDVLSARVEKYDPAMLDMLCLTGAVAWARLSSGSASASGPSALRRDAAGAFGGGAPTQVVGATPIALFLREHADAWLTLSPVRQAFMVSPAAPDAAHALKAHAAGVLDHLQAHGASFAGEIAAACGLDAEQLRAAIADLVAAGAISSDGFAGLRGIVATSSSYSPARAGRAEASGRWFVVRDPKNAEAKPAAVETLAWTLLRRYGVMCRRLLTREPMDVPWRELARVYRRLEARGEIRGGRFVTGLSGEQFALPDAVERLREVRRSAVNDRLITISGADPLNLAGIVTGDERIRASASTRIVYRNGIPVAAMEGDMLRTFGNLDREVAAEAAAAAAGRRVPVISGFVGRI
jgi:ATP-dependent Lhr-like helicase